MYYCPECNSSDVDLIEESEVKQFDEWSWQDVSVWECQDCKCIFEKIERTEIDLEVIEHGKEYEE